MSVNQGQPRQPFGLAKQPPQAGVFFKSNRPADNPPRYATKLRRPVQGQPTVVTFIVDFAGLGQLRPDQGFPVTLDLSWNFDNDLDAPCELYLKEFHLTAEEKYCQPIVGGFFEGGDYPTMTVTRHGKRWVFKAKDGHRLSGTVTPAIDQLYFVRQDDGETSLPCVT